MLSFLTIGAWDQSVITARNLVNLSGRVQAFHAADSALQLCETALLQGEPPVRDWLGSDEPGHWREPHALRLDSGGFAYAPVPVWPNAVEPPRCLIERWVDSPRPSAVAHLITAQGMGPSVEAQAWLQKLVLVESGRTESRWRNVAVAPI